MKTIAKTIAAVASSLFLVVFATVAQAGPTFTEVNLDEDGRWEVVYAGKTYNSSTNESTFTYTVTVNDDPALSHFTAGFPLCDTLTVVGYSPTELVSIGLDPTTGVYGIKWDSGQEPGTTVDYSFTLLGDIAEGDVQVAVKAGLFAALGTRSGPSCDSTPVVNTYSISGIVFVDNDKDGIADVDEALIANVTVALYDADGNLVGTVLTDDNGAYVFAGLVAGDYIVEVPSATDVDDFNDVLTSYMIATTAVSVAVPVSSDVTGIDFGFVPDVASIIGDLDEEDGDADGFVFPGEGRTIGFWKHQLAVAIKGKGRAQVDATSVASYIFQIETFFLADPFVLNGSFEAAFDVLKSTSSAPVDLLKKQLLGTEFNQMAGFGLSGDYAALQTVLLQWGETIVANSGSYTSQAIIEAKDVFDGINNLGH